MSDHIDSLYRTSEEVQILKHDAAIFKNLIKERQHPLDLVRELLSNAAAREVGATRIEVAYHHDGSEHIFEVTDDGCGMDFSGDQYHAGRLGRFLGLGISAIVGKWADEFSWKGLGSKLAYGSRYVEIDTRAAGSPRYQVCIDEPWRTLNNNALPRPRVTEYPGDAVETGTRIRVFGHPFDCHPEPFTFEEIRTFLLHRTFAGFTRTRDWPPDIVLSVRGWSQPITCGLPEFKDIAFPDGQSLDPVRQTLLVNLAVVGVRLKGFITFDAEQFGLGKDALNTGLILSSRGIPYFELPLDKYGARNLLKTPGAAKVCLVAECDDVYSEMNLSRSGLVDSSGAAELKTQLRRIFEFVESSIEYKEFRQLRTHQKQAAKRADVTQDRQQIQSDSQNWVVLERPDGPPLVLMREPRSQTEAFAILCKLESLGALPFEQFQTMGYPQASGKLDLFVQFQEEPTAEQMTAALFETENHFFSYKRHDGLAPQAPKVICWDAPS